MKVYGEPKSDVGRLVAQYKIALGVLPDDREWDKHFFARYAKYAKVVLDQIGSLEEAVSFMRHYGNKWGDQGLQWSLKAVADRAVLWKAQQRSIDQRKNNESNRSKGFLVVDANAITVDRGGGEREIVFAGQVL